MFVEVESSPSISSKYFENLKKFDTFEAKNDKPEGLNSEYIETVENLEEEYFITNTDFSDVGLFVKNLQGESGNLQDQNQFYKNQRDGVDLDDAQNFKKIEKHICIKILKLKTHTCSRAACSRVQTW